MNRQTMQALDVVGKMASGEDIQGIIDGLRDFGESCGYSHFCLSELPPEDTFTPRYFDYFPSGWAPYYIESEFYRVDPVRVALRSAVDPFRWSDAPVDGAPAARMMRIAAEDWRMREGFAVPIHSVTGAQANVSFVADRSDPIGDNHPGLHLVSIFAHLRIEELSDRATAPPGRDLSVRERDILSFAAAGRANREIAERLNLSDLDARVHLQSAARKLGARTRMQAIVHAHRAGLLGY